MSGLSTSKTLLLLDEEKNYIDDDNLEFYLPENIYNYVLLLFHHKHPTNHDRHLFSYLNKSQKVSLIFFAVMSWITQFISMAFLLLTEFWFGLENFTEDESSIGLNLEPSVHNFTNATANVTGMNNSSMMRNAFPLILNQQCTLKESFRVQDDPIRMTGYGFGARFVTIMLVFFSISGELTSVGRYSVMMNRSKRCTMAAMWCFLGCSQLGIIFVTVYRVYSLVMNQTHIIDVLTVGLGFVFIMDVDNKMLECVSFGNAALTGSLYSVRYHKRKLKKTIFGVVSPCVWDAFVWTAFGIGSVLVTIYYSFFFLTPRVPYSDPKLIMYPAYIALLMGVPLSAPFLYVILTTLLYYLCCCFLCHKRTPHSTNLLSNHQTVTSTVNVEYMRI